MGHLDSTQRETVFVSGAGIVSSIGLDLPSFEAALHAGRSGVRGLPSAGIDLLSGVPAALLPESLSQRVSALADRLPAETAQRFVKQARRAAPAVAAALVATGEAWLAAGMHECSFAPEEIALVIGGHNLAQNEHFLRSRDFRPEQADHVSPFHALRFMDGFVVGVLSEVFGLRGEGFTCGAASASSSVAAVQALRIVREGRARACVVVGVMADLSPLELAAFWNVGALGGRDLRAKPAQACRPFDCAHEGFAYGQASACLILQRAERAAFAGPDLPVELAGGSNVLHGSGSSEPNLQGELRAMRAALLDAGLAPADVDYVNAHGTSSVLGDELELQALDALFAEAAHKPWVNSTKGLTGHCLWSAGIVEAVATLVQMKSGFVHPNANLEQPISTTVRLAGSRSVEAELDVALSNSFGFGGFNSSLVLQKVRLADRPARQ